MVDLKKMQCMKFMFPLFEDHNLAKYDAHWSSLVLRYLTESIKDANLQNFFSV